MPKVPTAQEAGLGQISLRADRTPTQSFSTDVDMFGGVAARSLGQLAKGLSAFAKVGREIDDNNDRAAVSTAIQAAKDDVNANLLTNLYSKRGSEIFSEGKGPQQIYKNDSIYFDEARKNIAKPLLNNSRQEKLFTSEWEKFQGQEGRRMSTHLASQFRQYGDENAANEVAYSDEELGSIATTIESDWRNALDHSIDGHITIDGHLATGMRPNDAVEQHLKWDDYVASSAVRGWFSESINKLKSAEGLASGNLDNDEAQRWWDQLEPKQRKALRSDLINQASTVAKFRNDQRDASNDAEEEQVKVKANEFWTLHGVDQQAQRVEIYNETVDSPWITRAEKDAMRENLYGGTVTIDVEPGLVELEQSILNGDVVSIAEAEAFRFGGVRVATSETMRRRIFPLVESSRSSKFTSAMSGGLAQLGISDVAAETNTVLKQRASTFKFRMLEWSQSDEGREGDPWEQAMAISKQIQDEIKVDPAIAMMLSSLKTRYNDQLAAGNAIAATATLTSMNSLMSMLGLRMEDIK